MNTKKSRTSNQSKAKRRLQILRLLAVTALACLATVVLSASPASAPASDPGSDNGAVSGIEVKCEKIEIVLLQKRGKRYYVPGTKKKVKCKSGKLPKKAQPGEARSQEARSQGKWPVAERPRWLCWDRNGWQVSASKCPALMKGKGSKAKP